MIGHVIQEKRKKVGLTQAELAELLGVSAPAVNKWEKDICYPDIELIAPLARILQIDLNTLFSFYEELSEKERDLIVDELESIAETKPKDLKLKIAEILKQNPMDSNLYRDIADELYRLYVLNKHELCDVSLDDIAEYYEKSNELLPEKNNDISYSLAGIYATLGKKEQALSAWDDIQEPGLKKGWIKAEIERGLKEYDESLVDAKEVILREIIELGVELDWLAGLFSQVNRNDLSQLAYEKAHELRSMFGIWEGMEIITALIGKKKDGEKCDLEETAKQIMNITNNDTMTKCPLFDGIQLGGKNKHDSEIEDLASDWLTYIRNLK